MIETMRPSLDGQRCPKCDGFNTVETGPAQPVDGLVWSVPMLCSDCGHQHAHPVDRLGQRFAR